MFATGSEVRQACREGRWQSQTSGLAHGYVQANLVVLDRDWAWDFLVFAQRNPKPCPILEVGETGSALTRFIARGADIRTDLPRYRIYERGVLTAEPTDITAAWRDDLVYFLLGCSFSFEQALLEAGLEVRHITEGRNVPMYRTSLMCTGAGRFPGTPLVVTMRPYTPAEAIKAVSITRDFPAVHGAPVHIGDPAAIGIADLSKPEWGEAVTVREGEIPVFWACGVTPQMAAMTARPPRMITHAPGHMFVGDRSNHDYRI